MRSTHRSKLPTTLAMLAALILVLGACSNPPPQETAQDDLVTVELDGFTAQVELSKIDAEALSPQAFPRTEFCEPDQNVEYYLVPVPVLALVDKKVVPYVDVFWMPRRGWNGKLLLYAHGYVAPGTGTNFLELVRADPAQLESIDRFLCAGNAIGVSSYSMQGYAVQQGIAETHLMNAIFPLVFWRKPKETYILGSSMGGLITVALAETFPNRYDGAMPMCGPLAGSLFQFAYIGSVRLLFDQQFSNPKVLKGSLPGWEAPDPNWVEKVLGAITQDDAAKARFAALVNTKLSGGPFGYAELPAVQTPFNQDPPLGYDLASDEELAANALVHALRYSVLGAGDAKTRGGGSPFSNEGVNHEGIRDGPYVGRGDVPTLESKSAAVSYYTRYYEPKGNLQVPTLSLHTWVDPDVPTVHEEIYRQVVGESDMLRQYLVTGYLPDDLSGAEPEPIASRADSIYGHCNFRPVDLVTAFDALTQRVKDGDWPSTLHGPRFSLFPGN